MEGGSAQPPARNSTPGVLHLKSPSFLSGILQRPLLAAIIVVCIVFVGAIGLALAGSGSSSSSSNSATTSVAVAPDVAPTAAPGTNAATPAPTSVPSPVAPTVAPTAAAEANRADCDKIRGTDYLSETEHAWFIANCIGVRTTIAATQSASGGTASAPAPTGAGGDPVTALANALGTIRTYRATMVLTATGVPTQNLTIEAALPNRLHVAGGGYEAIAIGSDIYLRIGGAWSKQPPASIPGLSSIPDINTLLQQANLTLKGTDTVSGRSCQLFVSGAATVCVDSNYLPLRLTYADSNVQTSVFFTAINGPVSINAPV